MTSQGSKQTSIGVMLVYCRSVFQRFNSAFNEYIYCFLWLVCYTVFFLFFRIYTYSNNMHKNFVKADSRNMPKVDAMMVGVFFKNNPDFYAAELRNVKTAK